MQQSINLSADSAYFSQKLKHADGKKFHLRKAIYEMDKLSYEKGTRSGDYLIREKIVAINEELKSYDDKLKVCDFSTKFFLPIVEEMLPFFEKRYLDDFILGESIGTLKHELINQHNADIQHNIDHQKENYKRNINNPYRDELTKDLIAFEAKLSNTITPHLKEFLDDINYLLFIQNLNQNIDQWSISNVFNNIEIIFKKLINYFFIIYGKIMKVILSVDEIAAITDIILNESGLKSKLLRLKNIDETRLKNLIINCAKEYLSNISTSDRFLKNKNKDKIAAKENSQKIIQNEFEIVLEKLRLLTEYKRTLNISNYTFIENLSDNRRDRYLYYAPDSGDIKLKDVADYLKDSLIFISEWLLIVLKKNPDLLASVKSLVECLPAEIRFYDLFETANIISAGQNNQKRNLWGDEVLYVTKEIASELIGIIEFLCVELKDAFIRIIFDVELNNSSVLKIFEKKVNIIYDSFEDARKKIITVIGQLEKI
jgi:hypothetical protein